jgi:fructose-1,6-bisphosphatase/inositol monophosphatase family enzyme
MNRYHEYGQLKKAETVLPEALKMAVPILRGSLQTGQGEQIAKDDGTIATDIDAASERTLIAHIESNLDIPVVGEEGGRVGNYTGNERVVLVDPQDGTVSGRMHSTTATAGAAVYNPYTKQFEVGAVVDPYGGRLWYTEHDGTYRQPINVYTTESIGEAALVNVSMQSPESGGEILMDIMRGFARKDAFTGEKREVMNLQEKLKFLEALHELAGNVGTAASNLHHQALVADGGAAIASITSALGGPWDMNGLLLVENAGGKVRLLRREGKVFEEIDDPMEADMAIAANTKETMDRILGAIARISE